MAEEALILDIDIIEQEHRKELREKDQTIHEKDQTIHEKDASIHALQLMLKGIPDPEICRRTGLTQARLDGLRKQE